MMLLNYIKADVIVINYNIIKKKTKNKIYFSHSLLKKLFLFLSYLICKNILKLNKSILKVTLLHNIVLDLKA